MSKWVSGWVFAFSLHFSVLLKLMNIWDYFLIRLKRQSKEKLIFYLRTSMASRYFQSIWIARYFLSSGSPPNFSHSRQAIILYRHFSWASLTSIFFPLSILSHFLCMRTFIIYTYNIKTLFSSSVKFFPLLFIVLLLLLFFLLFHHFHAMLFCR